MEIATRRALLLALLLAAGGASAAQPPPPGKGDAFTVYAAYRDGGSFHDVASDNKLPIDASSAFAASLDLKLDPGTQLQLYVSRQSSDVDTRKATPQPGGPLPAKVPLKVTYAHIGGTAYLDRKIGQGAYVAGGLGATLFEPDLPGTSNELRPSLSLALGYLLPLGERFALRFEARGYATLVNSSSGVFCSGGCVVSIKGDTVTQGDVQIGFSFRY